MKFKELLEAKYIGRFAFADVYQNYKRLFLELRDDLSIDDASVRTISGFDDQTGKHEIGISLDIVFNLDKYTPESAKRRTKEILNDRGLPYDDISVESLGSQRIYIQVTYK